MEKDIFAEKIIYFWTSSCHLSSFRIFFHHRSRCSWSKWNYFMIINLKKNESNITPQIFFETTLIITVNIPHHLTPNIISFPTQSTHQQALTHQGTRTMDSNKELALPWSIQVNQDSPPQPSPQKKRSGDPNDRDGEEWEQQQQQ